MTAAVAPAAAAVLPVAPPATCSSGRAAPTNGTGRGGSPGKNSIGGFTGLVAEYAYYSDADTTKPTSTNTFKDPGAAYDGSVTLTYATGVPSAPTGVTGTVGSGSVTLQWTAPSSPGNGPVSHYVVRYSADGGSTWTTGPTSVTGTSTTVSGLTNGTGYVFEVAAVNTTGTGPYSQPSSTLTPSGPPSAPTITSITPRDGALAVNFTAP